MLMRISRLVCSTLVIVCMLLSFRAEAQVATAKRLSERSKEERERILIEQAKKVVTNPKYKRLYHPYDRVEIVAEKVRTASEKNIYNCYPAFVGEVYYLVYFYDSQTPQFEWGKFAMCVTVLDENGAVESLMHGNGGTAFICGNPLYRAEPKTPKPAKPKIRLNRNRRF